ncbi:amidase family protein [Streptomyces sp. SLBN-118]|uniref:amidase family protein n=1 Tax=Streptomyces sp. SLBN-118 TaxID=2768454 RepID=UPI00115091DF
MRFCTGISLSEALYGATGTGAVVPPGGWGRLTSSVAFTPLNNVVASPAISLPARGATEHGLPIGVMFSARNGDERTLLDIAFAREADQPWRRIQDGRAATA